MPATSADFDTFLPRSYYEQPCADRIHTAGVDYVSVTQAPGKDAEKLWTAASLAAAQESLRGNRAKCSTWNNYDLIRCGSVAVGKRQDGVFVSLSGHAAYKHWRRVLPLAGNVTRLDLQVTAVFMEPRPDLARQSFSRVPDDTGRSGRPGSVGIHAFRDYGDTLTFGARGSTSFGRHYDKSAQLKLEPKGSLWRWEVELRDRQAWATSVSLVGTDTGSPFIQNWVYSWFWKRGLRPGFPLRDNL